MLSSKMIPVHVQGAPQVRSLLAADTEVQPNEP